MKKEFFEKVIRQGIVDTKKYRYKYSEDDGTVKRLPLADLDTTEALRGWETVHAVKPGR